MTSLCVKHNGAPSSEVLPSTITGPSVKEVKQLSSERITVDVLLKNNTQSFGRGTATTVTIYNDTLINSAMRLGHSVGNKQGEGHV